MDLIQGAMAILSGGATGLLGVIAGKIFEGWQRKQDIDKIKLQHEHAVAMKKADAEIMAQEWAARTKMAEVEAAGREAVADAAAFSASFGQEPKRYSEGMEPPKGGKVAKFVQGAGWYMMVCVDALRAIVRPGLTLYLCWIATRMYEESRAAMAMMDLDGTAQQEMLSTVHSQIVYTMLYLFVTCVTWWFGTRQKSQPPKLG
jgi:hypothetical protein